MIDDNIYCNEIITIPNNGVLSHDNKTYRNQCFWISIIDYFRYILDKTINIKEIREFGNNNINTESSFTDVFEHEKGIRNVIKTLNIKYNKKIIIILYEYNKNSNIITLSTKIAFDQNEMIGDNIKLKKYKESSSYNIIYIISYGAHFELLLYIDEQMVYNIEQEIDQSIQHSFKPNYDLALPLKLMEEIIELALLYQNKKLTNDLLEAFQNNIFSKKYNKYMNEFKKIIDYFLNNNDKYHHDLSQLIYNISIIKNDCIRYK